MDAIPSWIVTVCEMACVFTGPCSGDVTMRILRSSNGMYRACATSLAAFAATSSVSSPSTRHANCDQRVCVRCATYGLFVTTKIGHGGRYFESRSDATPSSVMTMMSVPSSAEMTPSPFASAEYSTEVFATDAMEASRDEMRPAPAFMRERKLYCAQ